ncbi:MAG TPA: hypothetical protein PK869_16380 [Candidatus Hydrogenedentes bacterium]|nr:hypothetical protein [Candidatus Hydrogenedentota bacterium]
MKKLLLPSLLTTSTLAADLQLNAQLTFDYPELPNMVSGTTNVASARHGDWRRWEIVKGP